MDLGLFLSSGYHFVLCEENRKKVKEDIKMKKETEKYIDPCYN